MPKKIMNIAIVGGGASGLFLTKMLSQNFDFNITLFEKSDNIGRKIKASGGGRANLLNDIILPQCYNQALFMQSFLAEVDAQTVKKVFEDWGLLLRSDSENRVYPLSNFSQTVVDLFLHNLPKNVTILCNYAVQSLENVGSCWKINGEDKLFDKLILASGSIAGLIFKNRVGYNDYFQNLNLEQTPLQPSLVGFKIMHYPKILSGCRAKAMVSLFQNDSLIFKEAGEVTFKDDGVSGIVILNLSAYYNRLQEKKDCVLSFNFINDIPDFDKNRYLKRYGDFTGVVHPKLNQLFKEKNIDIQDFRLEIQDTYDFVFAQVCHGGIQLKEINAHFAVKRYENLYAVGEMLDIDGVCGGYNLFFAFASALKVAKIIEYESKN